MFCRNCGSDVTNMKYCQKCGTCTETGNAQSFDTEANLAQKLIMQQASALSFSVFMTAWGLFSMIFLFPYITCRFMNDFSNEDLFLGASFILYIVFSVGTCVGFYAFIKVTEYTKTPSHKLIGALAVNRSSGLQMIIFGFIIVWKLFDGDWLNIGVIALILCGIMWVWYFFSFKEMRCDKKMIITIIYKSFLEFWVSILIAIGLCYLISEELLDRPIIALGTLALIFVYPIVRFIQTI